MRRTLLSLLVLVASSGVVSLDGQAPAQPAFRAGTTVVEVSAIVTMDGVPVTDLRADEVVVLDNGKPQELVAFEFVDLGRVEGPAQRRDFVVFFDAGHVSPERTQPSIEAVLELIARLGAHDRLALVTTGVPERALDFTTDREAARAFTRALRGQQFSSPPVLGELEFRARLAMDQLAGIVAGLRADAERRAVLVISEGHPTLGQNAEWQRSASNGYTEFLDVIRQAALANVALYTVDPRGLRAPGGAWKPSRQSVLTGMSAGTQISPDLTGGSALSSDVTGSLAVLALNTGGIQTRWTNDLTANLTRMIEDSRQYYRLAYVQPEPALGKAQPQTRGIKVKVTRPGVDVRARQRYAPARDAS